MPGSRRLAVVKHVSMVISADYSTHYSTDYSKHFSSAMRNGLRTDKSEIVQLSETSESLD